MRRRYIINIIKKEWEDTLSNLNTLLLITLAPLLIIGQGLLVIYLVVRFAGEGVLMSPMFQTAMEKLEAILPSIAELPPIDKLQVLLFSQLHVYLLLIPVMIAITFATFSIIEEKQSRSLEPLLATPVRTDELFIGKALAGSIPALVMTWLCAGLSLIGIACLGTAHILGAVVTPSCFISVFLLVPAVTVLSFLLGTIISSRVNDPRNAQNISLLIILPVLALIAVQVIGVLLLTPLLFFIIAVIVGVVDLIVLRIGVRLFQRESIIIQWR